MDRNKQTKPIQIVTEKKFNEEKSKNCYVKNVDKKTVKNNNFLFMLKLKKIIKKREERTSTAFLNKNLSKNIIYTLNLCLKI